MKTSARVSFFLAFFHFSLLTFFFPSCHCFLLSLSPPPLSHHILQLSHSSSIILVRNGHVEDLDAALAPRLAADKVREPLEGPRLHEADHLPLRP